MASVWAVCVELSWRTAYWEPNRPCSSPENQPKRILYFSGMPSLRIWWAIARFIAVPEPSSLMPGPAATPSMWAPTCRTRVGSPPGVSARMS